MADSATAAPEQRRHLDAAGDRSVVFCHYCEHEWYRDEHGLVCPECDSEATEIVTTDNDPREINEAPEFPHYPDVQRPFFNPWADHHAPDHTADGPGTVAAPRPNANIEHNMRRFPGGGVVITSTFRGPMRTVQGTTASDSPNDIFRNFQDMVTSMMGPQVRMGEPGRSGPDTLFGREARAAHRPQPAASAPQPPSPPPAQPTFRAQRYTFVSPGGLRPRNAAAPQPMEDHVDPFHTLLEELFAPPLMPRDDDDEDWGGPRPMGLQGLLASIFNPAHAVAGDAVYTQEALDRIISALMEQHPSSNAPGPASDAAIAALPKKQLDEKMLGPELKGECSVCMEDVFVGEEMAVLPCKHWFHETCASSWLREHNTCPICRTSIGDGTTAPPPPSPAPEVAQATTTAADPVPRSINLRRRSSRDEARLESIRARGRLSPLHHSSSGLSRSRHEAARERSPSPSNFHMPGMFSGGAAQPSMRRRDSDMSSSQRESRRLADTHRNASSHSRRGSNADAGPTTSSGGGGGALGWLRDHLPGASRRHD